MTRLSKIEKKEEALMAEYKEYFLPKIASQSLDIDTYIEFLSYTNSFANHSRKAFRKIEDRVFKI